MKNLKPIIISTIFCYFFFLISYNSLGQINTLSYKVKGKSTLGVDITFADEDGTVDLIPTEYFNYSDIYFVLTPTSDSPKDFFREDDANKILSKILRSGFFQR